MIRIENLTKDYDTVRAVDSINFKVQDGEILGFLGPNGAGKTTTLRVMTSYLAPTNGNVYVDDMNVIDDSEEIRKQIGYLAEHNPLYDEMNVHDFLVFIANTRKINKNDIKVRIKEVVELCGLKEVIHRPINEISKGFRQRVGLAQAIIHDPKILILDEPTTGLDPNQIVEIRELIKALGKRKTVIISSHILQEIQATADRTVIINNGQIVADGTIEELMSSFRGHTLLEMELKNADEESVKKLTSLDDRVAIDKIETMDSCLAVALEYPASMDLREKVFDFAIENKWKILEMKRHKVSLEDIFRNLTVEGGKSNEK